MVEIVKKQLVIYIINRITDTYKQGKANKSHRLKKYLLMHNKAYEQGDILAWNRLFQERTVKYALITRDVR